MNFTLDNWNNNDYKNFINYLEQNKDLKYKDFHYKLVNDNIPFIGIRTPLLKKIAKEISKGNYISFIKLNTHKTYEEIVIHGLILGYIKENNTNLLDDFLPFITNWAINDLVVCNLKIFKKNQLLGYEYAIICLNSNNPWVIRFGLVILLSYYINDLYIDNVLKVSNNVKSNHYYVQMANAWLISICYIKYKEKTTDFLKTTNIDNFTYNKAISKICDSYRVIKEDKDELKKMKK